jgi:hypothetical protein
MVRKTKPRVFEPGMLGYSPFSESIAPARNESLFPPGGTTVATSNGAPITDPVDLAREMTRMSQGPISEIVSGRIMDKSMSIAAVSPILGQYAGKISYPDDWGYYFEYLYAYLLVPEVEFAVNMKNRLIWSPGWTIETSSEATEKRIMKQLKKMRFQQEMKNLSKTAFIMGNGYATLASDADYIYKGDDEDPRWEGKDPTKLYGFKILDPRTMRRFISPDFYDNEINDLEIIKYIQRAYNSPLGLRPRMQYLTDKRMFNELPLHPNITLHLRFNRILGSTYGYSLLRETLAVLKGWLIMYQFLPLIFQRRADPLLHIKFGGNIFWNNQQMTILPRSPDQMARQRAFLMNRNPGDDLFSDFLTSIEEVYKTPNSLRGMDALVNIWDRRIWKGMNVPNPNLPAPNENEVESLLNETKEHEDEITDMINRQILPLITSREAEFRFNDLVPDDWMAKARIMQQLYQSGLINQKGVGFILGIPPEFQEGAVPFCFVPGTTWVFTNGRPNPIEARLVDNHILNENAEPVDILFKRTVPYHGSIYDIKASYLRPFSVTPNHVLRIARDVPKLITERKNRTYDRLKLQESWMRADQVKPGDFLIIPKHPEGTYQTSMIHDNDRSPVPRQLTIDEDIGELLGWYVAEGSHNNDGHMCFSLNKSEVRNISRIQSLLLRRLNLRSSVHSYIGNCSVIHAHSIHLCRWLDESCGRGARNKMVPKEIFKSPSSVKLSFIRALISGDGHIGKRILYLGTNSSRLYHEVAFLCTSIGVIPYMYEKMYSGKTLVVGRMVNRNPHYRLEFYGRERELLGYTRGESKTKRYSTSILRRNDRIYIPIREISISEYNGDVINVETGDGTLLIPFISHNSTWGMNPTFAGQPAMRPVMQTPPESKPPRMKSPKASGTPNYRGLSAAVDKGKRVPTR